MNDHQRLVGDLGRIEQGFGFTATRIGAPGCEVRRKAAEDQATVGRAVDLLCKARVALFMCAAHCQGGHSEAGFAASQSLGIPFPITMADLASKAVEEGLDLRLLWPWANHPIALPIPKAQET